MNDARFMREIEGFSSDDTLFTTIKTIGSLFDDFSNDELKIVAEEYYMHSSRKRLSPICRKWVQDAVDLTAFINKIATALVTKYGRNWARIYLAYFKTDYKPLDNYDMTETKTPRVETTVNVNTGTDLTNSQKSQIYGFNSVDPVGDTKNEVTTTGDKTKNETTSVTSYDGFDTLERHGNIGVMSSSELLSREIEVRKYDFWNEVFADIDRLLCYILTAC